LNREKNGTEGRQLPPVDKYIAFASRLLREKKFVQAENLYKQTLRIQPCNYDVLLRLATLQLARGKTVDAIDTCRYMLEKYPNSNDAYRLMADALLPGDNYLKLLKKIHRHMAPDSYVEIGVETGQSLALVPPGTKAVGIDPYLQISHSLSPTTNTFEMTSDHFFATHDLLKVLGTQNVELAFIDGLHLFEQVLKDFINIEACSRKNSVILLHDCYPLDKRTTLRKRETDFWSGDSWKVLLCLKELRPDLTIFTVPCAPTGMGIVSNLDPDSTSLKENFDEIVNKFMEVDFDFLEENKHDILNVIPNSWDKIAARFPEVFK
jgi:tetratricopeptide (TPR) repeat protein